MRDPLVERFNSFPGDMEDARKTKRWYVPILYLGFFSFVFLVGFAFLWVKAAYGMAQVYTDPALINTSMNFGEEHSYFTLDHTFTWTSPYVLFIGAPSTAGGFTSHLHPGITNATCRNIDESASTSIETYGGYTSLLVYCDDLLGDVWYSGETYNVSLEGSNVGETITWSAYTTDKLLGASSAGVWHCPTLTGQCADGSLVMSTSSLSHGAFILNYDGIPAPQWVNPLADDDFAFATSSYFAVDCSAYDNVEFFSSGTIGGIGCSMRKSAFAIVEMLVVPPNFVRQFLFNSFVSIRNVFPFSLVNALTGSISDSAVVSSVDYTDLAFTFPNGVGAQLLSSTTMISAFTTDLCNTACATAKKTEIFGYITMLIWVFAGIKMVSIVL